MVASPIDKYLSDIDSAYSDALDNDFFKSFIDEREDVEVSSITSGQYQYEVRAIKKESAKRMLGEIFQNLGRQYDRLKKLLCEDLDYCEKKQSLSQHDLIKMIFMFLERHKSLFNACFSISGYFGDPTLAIIAVLAVNGKYLDDLCGCNLPWPFT